jgi:hypothetical protein
MAWWWWAPSSAGYQALTPSATPQRRQKRRGKQAKRTKTHYTCFLYLTALRWRIAALALRSSEGMQALCWRLESAENWRRMDGRQLA